MTSLYYVTEMTPTTAYFILWKGHFPLLLASVETRLQSARILLKVAVCSPITNHQDDFTNMVKILPRGKHGGSSQEWALQAFFACFKKTQKKSAPEKTQGPF